MKKFIVETYYTCTFKTTHTLDELNDNELSKIDNRSDGDVEVIDVKLNNRKTRKIGAENKVLSSGEEKTKISEIGNPILIPNLFEISEIPYEQSVTSKIWNAARANVASMMIAK